MKRFPIPSQITLASCAPLSDYFCSMIADGQEGLMVKGERSMYKPGKRVNWHKVRSFSIELTAKLKLGYMGLGETAEYAVLGGSYESSQNTFLKISNCVFSAHITFRYGRKSNIAKRVSCRMPVEQRTSG